MKAVAFVGSANKNGNTATPVKRILEGINTRGIETELYYLTDYLIKPCLGCRYCEKTNICRIKDDDTHILHEAIRESSGIILGTPTYYGDITGQFKQFVDRCYPFIKITKDVKNRKMSFGSIIEKQKLGLLVAVSGTHGKEVFDSHIKVAGHCFNDINTKLWDSLLITNTTWEPVNNQHPAFNAAFELGKRFAEELISREKNS